MKRTALILMILTVLSKVLGFSREIVLAYFYGASSISDAYLISWTIPGVIFSFIGVAITTTFIPLYTKIENEKGPGASLKYMNGIISFMILINTLIVILVLIFAPIIVKIFASGFRGQSMDLAVTFTRISIIGIFFSGFVYIFTGFLQVNKSFVVPALIGLPFNCVLILSIYLSSKFNIELLAIGIVIAKIAELILLFPFAKKLKYSYKLNLNFKDRHLKEMLFLSLPLILGVSVNQINILVDRTIASTISAGGISALNYASRLNSFTQGIFVMSLATVMYPLISKMAAENNINGLKKTIAEAVGVINILVIPATIGSMIFSTQIVELLFGRGAFDFRAIAMSSSALIFYSIGMIGIGLREVISRVFYSLHDTKTPVTNAVFGVGLNIALNLILSRYLGIGGLALATSIAATFTTILLFISLRKKIGAFGMKQISISFLKITFASSIMGLFAKLSFNYLTATLSQNLSLLLAIGVAAASYFAIIYFMKIEDVDVIVGAIRKKLGRGSTKL